MCGSTDLGHSWRSIAGDRPAGTIVWSLQQDHVDPDLIFLGTEFGIYFTPNGGTNWFELGGGVPTIPFRDLKLQRRDQDLVGATFGRGFYVLDDYSPLRAIAAGALEAEASLFPVRDAWWPVPPVPGHAPGRPTQGRTASPAPNPPLAATAPAPLRAPPTPRRGREPTGPKGKSGRSWAKIGCASWARFGAHSLHFRSVRLAIRGPWLRSRPCRSNGELQLRTPP